MLSLQHLGELSQEIAQTTVEELYAITPMLKVDGAIRKSLLIAIVANVLALMSVELAELKATPKDIARIINDLAHEQIERLTQ